MLIFSLDTSGPTAGVALWLDGTIVYEAVVKNKMTHSESIMPMTEEAYLRAGLNVKDTDYFCAVTGPGSFTGVRIGVTAVKAMAHAAQKPCIEVRALEAMARSAGFPFGLICPMQDARAGQVYAALYDGSAALLPDRAKALTEVLAEVRALSGERPVLFTGDGMLAHQQEIAQVFEGPALFAPAESCFVRPAAAAALAAERTHLAVPDSDLHPFSLRPPQAVRQKNLVEHAPIQLR